jgi:hypothetical protein
MISRPTLNKFLPAFCIFIVFISSIEVFSQTKRALIIGIDKYAPSEKVNQRSIRQKWSNLDGAVNDALAVKEILISKYGFQEENIAMLLDSLKTKNIVATKENILLVINENLIQNAEKGDIVFIYYAGHGSQIVNSKSPEKDKKDETIVPSDSYLSTNDDIRDIRDKELAQLFNQLIDKGVILTLIFDSCHSGSIARGKDDDYKERKLEPIEIDIADPEDFIRPEERENGALVLSAAQDYQTAKETKDENGNPHGAFTAALLQALRTSSVAESATSVFSRIKAIVESTGRDQYPVIAGPEVRKNQNLFGIDADKLKSKTVVAVLSNKESEIVLQGGVAIGLREGAELQEFRNSQDDSKIIVKVAEERGLNKCVVTIIKGDESDIHPGDLFEVTRWAVPDNMTLNIYIPETDYSYEELYKIAAELSQLQQEKNITLTDEPVDEKNVFELYYLNLEWKLKNLRNGKSEALGKEPSVSQIKKIIQVEKVFLYINLPPSIEMKEIFNAKLSSINSSVKITSQKEAKYFLGGRIVNDKLEYALYLPELSHKENNLSSLPFITDWVQVTGPDKLDDETNKINDTAFKLAKINAWLTLEIPEDESSFPYRLALKNSNTSKLVTEGNVVEGEIYGLTLTLDSLLLKNWDKNTRWIYVLGIDSYGEISLFYPGSGNVENREPETTNPLPTEILLGNKKLFQIGKPFGPDTYILLTSNDQIPNPELMESKGLRTRSASRGNALVDLLSNIGTTTRAGTKIIPVDWSINRITTVSVQKK